MRGDVFDSEDILEMHNIAALCPEEYGGPVDWARSYLDYEGKGHFELLESCVEEQKSNERSTERLFVSISPNPSTAKFWISFDDVFTGRVDIHNNMGILMESQVINGLDDYELDLSDSSNGIYYITLNDGQGKFEIKKLIKIE